jgi:hypothetical protein
VERCIADTNIRRRNEASPKNKKTRILLTLLSVAALTAITFNTSGALLSPRAAGNQIKAISGTATDPNLVAADQGLAASPRATGNEVATSAGTNGSVNPALACRSMAGTPKSIQACAEHPATMPGCVKTVAAAN